MASQIIRPEGTDYKKAGFWIKLLSRLLDIIPIAVLVVVSAFLYMKHSPINGSTDNIWHFVEPWEFYVWGGVLVLLLLLQFIVVPLISEGQTFGQWATRTKVVALKGSISKAILKRETFFAFAWILSSILVIALINHTLITKYAATDQKDINYTTLESLRIGIVSTVGSITMLIQLIVGISVLVRKDKKGLHDVYANTTVVYINKFIKLNENEQIGVERPKPRHFKNAEVEWIR